MTIPNFNFTRVPSVKTRVKTQIDTLTGADDTLVLIGKQAAGGGTVAVDAIAQIDSFGDPVAAKAECDAKFGADSELGDMVVAAIKGVLYSDLPNKVFPKLKAIVLDDIATSASLAATLAKHLTVPMPYVAVSYGGTDAAALTAVKDHLIAIGGEDRGKNGQFGSFGFMAIDADTATATPVGLSGASEVLCFPWLRDLAGTKANKLHEVCAAYAAVCAGNSIPFNPITDIKVGGLAAPVDPLDHHTDGDTGTAALGLSAGVVPLFSNQDGSISVSRAVTSRRPIASVEETAYFDMHDWQVLYYFRKNCWVKASRQEFKIAKASVQKAQALNSAFLKIAKDLEALEMFQHVDLLADQFTFARQAQNRAAFVFSAPVNVIPGFYNKGIEIVGTTQFDSVIA